MKLLRRTICMLLCTLFCAGCASPEGDKMETKLLNYTIEQAEYPAYPRFVNPEDYYKADGGWDHAAYNKAEEDYRQALLSMGKCPVCGKECGTDIYWAVAY